MDVADPTIAAVLDAFSAAQAGRVSADEHEHVEDVLFLLRSYLDEHGVRTLSREERRFFDEHADEEVTFCDLFGPEKIVPALEGFLTDYVVRDAAPGRETLRAAGTTCEALVLWLADQGYATQARTGPARARAARAEHDLPRADELAGLLYGAIPSHPEPADETLDLVDEEVEIARTAPGRLWFARADGTEIGPVRVPDRARELAEPGWRVSAVHLARVGREWVLLELGNVYPIAPRTSRR